MFAPRTAFSSVRTILAPVGTRLYAVGDIHGRADLLERMLALILADARCSRATRKIVVFLGDYVDRGPDSRAVVEMLRQGPPALPAWSGFRWVCLKGNHEDMMLRFLADPASGPNWMANGALATIGDYVGADLSAESGTPLPPLARLHDIFKGSVPPEHAAFLAGLPLHHAEGDYYLVHAGVRPGVPLERQGEADMLWIRRSFLNSGMDFGKMIVHGHSIVTRPEAHANRVAVDTGAFFSGRLTAMVAEGAQMAFIST